METKRPRSRLKRIPVLCLLLFATHLATGCATAPYTYTQRSGNLDINLYDPGEPQFVRGRPHAFVDGIGHYVFSLPSKLLLWNWHIDNHHISPETEAALREYMEENGLMFTKVRINQYSPGAEWKRLHRNRGVGFGWRATLGLLSMIQYTIFPGRIFGGDNYNPFTNTINLYSDHPAVAIHEGGHAKDFAPRKYKGTYAALYVLPLAPLYTEALATGDAVGYLKEKSRTREEKDAYKVLYPAYATYIAGEGTRWVPLTIWEQYGILAAAVIPAHIAGRVKAAAVEETPAKTRPEERAPGEVMKKDPGSGTLTEAIRSE